MEGANEILSLQNFQFIIKNKIYLSYSRLNIYMLQSDKQVQFSFSAKKYILKWECTCRTIEIIINALIKKKIEKFNQKIINA